MKYNQIKNRDSYKRVKEQSAPIEEREIEKEMEKSKN